MVTAIVTTDAGDPDTAMPNAAAVGAFFDFDGTVAAGFTGALLPWDCLRRGDMSVGDFMTTLWVAVNYSAGRLDFEDFIRRGSMTLRGRHTDELPALGERLYTEYIAARIYPEMTGIIAGHLASGHTVVLTTAAFHLQVAPVAQTLGIAHVLCNWCATDDDGVLNGEVKRPILRGRTKAEAASNFAAENGIDLALSYFYADGDEDIPLMSMVGHPRPTNPGSKLSQLAADANWPILRLSSRSGSLPIAAPGRRWRDARRGS
jgi:putative phosphoserine phosphatase / 1-acylglycerol-3-phosphate O-acyltransferase